MRGRMFLFILGTVMLKGYINTVTIQKPSLVTYLERHIEFTSMVILVLRSEGSFMPQNIIFPT